MIIKEAKSQEEIESISKKAIEIWNQHFVPIIGQKQVDYMLDLFLSTEAISKGIEEEHYHFFSLTDDKLIGFFSIKQDDQHSLFLSKLYVELASRGKGYARKALNYIEEYAKNHDCNVIWLTCNKYNDNTLAIYKKMGFEIFDEAVNDIGNGYVMDDYYLRKVL